MIDISTGDILIFSGEGDTGTWTRYHGARTRRSLMSRLARERCHGDRLASAWIVTDLEDKGYPGTPVYAEIDRDLDSMTGRMRAVVEIIDKPSARLAAMKSGRSPKSRENGKLGGRPKRKPAPADREDTADQRGKIKI
jgi:hypothetical protein